MKKWRVAAINFGHMHMRDLLRINELLNVMSYHTLPMFTLDDGLK